MSDPNIRLCSHLMTNGLLCSSPALRGLRFCYFHEHWRRSRRTSPGTRSSSLPSLLARAPISGMVAQGGVPLELPLLEDANAVQLALQQIMQAIILDQLDLKRAGLLLYALQTASSNLKHTSFQPIGLGNGMFTHDLSDYPDESDENAAPLAADAEGDLEELPEEDGDDATDEVPEEEEGADEATYENGGEEDQNGGDEDDHGGEQDQDGGEEDENGSEEEVTEQEITEEPAEQPAAYEPVQPSDQLAGQQAAGVHAQVAGQPRSPDDPITRSPDGPITRSPDGPITRSRKKSPHRATAAAPDYTRSTDEALTEIIRALGRLT